MSKNTSLVVGIFVLLLATSMVSATNLYPTSGTTSKVYNIYGDFWYAFNSSNLNVGKSYSSHTEKLEIFRPVLKFDISDLNGVLRGATFKVDYTDGKTSANKVSLYHTENPATLDKTAFELYAYKQLSSSFSSGSVDIFHDLKSALETDSEYTLQARWADESYGDSGTGYVAFNNARIEYWMNSKPEVSTIDFDDGRITLNASDSDSDSISFDVYYSSGVGTKEHLIASGLTSPDYTWNTNTVPTGTYYLDVVANDGYEETLVSSDSFIIDNNPPSVNVVSPAGGELWNKAQEITWSASDADGDPITLDVYVSGTLIASDVDNTGKLLLSTTDFDDGNYTIKLVAESGYRSAEAVSDGSFEIDNTVPEIVSFYPLEELYSNSSDLNFSVYATDLNLEDADFEIFVNDVSYDSFTIAPLDGNFSPTVSGLADGNVVYASGKVNDKAGNSTEFETSKYTVDLSPPITIDNLASETYDANVSVSLSATDEISGVSKTFYKINDSDWVEGAGFELTDEGTYEIQYYSMDNVGNTEVTNSASLLIDFPEPAVEAPEDTSSTDEEVVDESPAADIEDTSSTDEVVVDESPAADIEDTPTVEPVVEEVSPPIPVDEAPKEITESAVPVSHGGGGGSFSSLDWVAVTPLKPKPEEDVNTVSLAPAEENIPLAEEKTMPAVEQTKTEAVNQTALPVEPEKPIVKKIQKKYNVPTPPVATANATLVEGNPLWNLLILIPIGLMIGGVRVYKLRKRKKKVEHLYGACKGQSNQDSSNDNSEGNS